MASVTVMVAVGRVAGRALSMVVRIADGVGLHTWGGGVSRGFRGGVLAGGAAGRLLVFRR
ncbi:hypothetical protein LP52_13550 [Streptomonospora alba]|uniref:Uncharacterized protein n=1 Tax=Streptomonospora alba TaxID=183763 RepID=A0A0C2FGM6_9ACTN|nr:hypothetical protein LP52_13550 [Streptomonospora alba]